MKLFNNKKAEADETGYNLPYFIVLAIALVILFAGQVAMYNTIKNYKLEVDDSVYELSYVNRILNSPDCFTYESKVTGRIYEGVIDLNKFNSENLENCFGTNDTDASYNFELVLKDLFTGQEFKPIKNENFYQAFHSTTRLVQIRKANGDMVLGKLNIYIDT